MQLYGLWGQNYQLEQKPFSSGGEGEIYRIVGNNNSVVKVYLNSNVSKELENKIKLMVKRPPSSSVFNQVAWPIDAVYDSANVFRGFVMPKLDITSELSEVYVYPPKTGITYKQKLILAQNICVVIHEVHKAGYVFGDFNPRNIGINLNTGTVAFLDTDSYHIVIDRDVNIAYRCKVCAPGYAAPELLSKCSYHISAHPEDKQQAYARTPLDTFTEHTDNFALAIHIFKLLMNGFTPFNGIPEKHSVLSAPSPGLGDGAVRRDNYCFKKGNKPLSVAVPPLNVLPKDVQSLFSRAFIEGRDNPEKRPNAMEWYKALLVYENSIVTCNKNPVHMYIKGLRKCPWCEADDRYNVSIAQQIQQRTFANPVTPSPVVPVVSPANTNASTQNVSPTRLNTYGTTTTSITVSTPSQKQCVNRDRIKEKLGRFFNVIGWLAFVCSIIYIFMPLVSGGSIHLDETYIYKIDVTKDAIIASIGVALVCFGSHFALSKFDKLATTLSGFWSCIFCLSAATVRYIQMGYNAASAKEAWKIFGILILSFGAAVVLGGKLGTMLRMGVQVSNSMGSKVKHQYTPFETFFILLMHLSSYALLPMLLDLSLYYHWIELYNLITIAIWVFPIVVFLIFRFSPEKNFYGKAVEDCFSASMATYFTCLVLWIGHVSGDVGGAVGLWVTLAIIGSLFIVFIAAEIESPFSALTVLLFFVFFVAGAIVDLKVMNEGVRAVGDILHWLVSGPAIILIAISSITTLKEI